MNDVLLVVVVLVALGFDFTNGFHDTANAVATSVSTRAVPPRLAVPIAAVANLAGAFVTTAVAKTVGKGIIDTGLANEKTILAALFGAITWNLITWWLGLPSSSSHALIGGLVGAAIAQSGAGRRPVARARAQRRDPGAGGPAGRVRRRVPAPDRDLLAPPPHDARVRQPHVPARAARVRNLGRVHPRRQRRAEDDGRDRARALRERAHLPLLHPDLGDRDRGPGDRRRNLCRRLADHAHPRSARDQDGAGKRLCRADDRRRDHLPRHEARLPALDHARDLRLGARCRRDQAALGRPLGRRRQHRLRLAADDPGSGPRRGGALLALEALF